MINFKKMNLIKKTKSLCPKCLKEINASVYQKDDLIWMFKECKNHGKFKGLLEKDPEFYKKTANYYKSYDKRPLSIMVCVTHRCNLRCKFCYVPNKSRKDMSIGQLKRLIERLPPFCHNFAIGGGEPTLKEDLFDIISLLKKRVKIKIVGMTTNGIKLADEEYVKKLKKTGLDWVLLSFNGFNDRIYKKINNRNLFDIKMKALKNLKKLGITTVMSFTLIRGLNEKDVKKGMDYAFENHPQIFGLRIRGAARVGVYDKINDPFCTSELLDIVAKSLGLSKEFFLKDFQAEKCYHSPYQFNLKLVFVENKEKKRKLVYWDHGDYSKNKSIVSKRKVYAALKISRELLFNEGPLELMKFLEGQIGHKIPFLRRMLFKKIYNLKSLKTLHIHIWGWPDSYNIDLNDIQFPGIHMTYDGKLLSFFEAMVRNKEL